MATDSDQEGDISDKLKMEEKKSNDKFIKILTVLGYVICVSSAGMMLSLYYIFIWDPYSAMATPQALTAAQTTYGGLTKECSNYIERSQQSREMLNDQPRTSAVRQTSFQASTSDVRGSSKLFNISNNSLSTVNVTAR